MHRSLWLTVAGISEVVYIRYHRYIASPLSGNGTEFREISYTGSSDDISGCDNLRIGSPSQYYSHNMFRPQKTTS
jgi:hypothetical protein